MKFRVFRGLFATVLSLLGGCTQLWDRVVAFRVWGPGIGNLMSRGWVCLSLLLDNKLCKS